MCDQDHFEEDLKKYSRRDLGALAALGIGASILFPNDAQAADAQESELLEKEVTIKTPDGECDAYFVTPASQSHAAVLVWPDIFGLFFTGFSAGSNPRDPLKSPGPAPHINLHKKSAP